MRGTSIITAAAVAVILPTALAAATASGSAGTAAAEPAASTESTASAGEFSACMREHGLADFPDAHLTEHGTVQLDGAWVDPFSAEYVAALDACEELLPAGATLPGSVEPPAPEAPAAPSAVETPAAPEAPPSPPAPEPPTT